MESGFLDELRVCSTPPPGISLSTTTASRITRRSTSTESELLDKMCSQISDRLERLLTPMEAQTNDRTAWAGWMSSAMVKIHADLWTNYQMRSMDLLNQAIKESKLLTQRDIQRQELDKEKTLDDWQKQQQQFTITQMPPPTAPGPRPVASSTPVPQASDTQGQTTVIFQSPSVASASGVSRIHIW